MEEPNLNYINNLSDGDELFKKQIIMVIKKEFPKEIKSYYEAHNNKEFIKVAEIVHKIKHKISILGLAKGYQLAQEYELKLKRNSDDLKESFEEVIITITKYIKTL